MPSLYAGLDVSDKSTAVCIVTAKGATVLETETATAPDAIAAVLKPFKRQLKCVGQESGNMAPWLEQGLARAKFPMVCLDPAKAHASLNGRLNKTDVNDARGLALILATGIYSRAHVKSVEAVRIRSVLLLRESIVRKGQDLSRSLTATGKRLKVDQQKAAKRVSLRSESREALRAALGIVKASAAAMSADRLKLDKIITALAKENDVCCRFMKIPGVGPITALSFFAAIDDPKRFASSRNVGAYFGLTPRTFQSGESSRSGGISHRGDSMVRRMLYIAAFSMLVKSKSKCSVRRWGLKVARTKGSKVAYVAVARKLAVLMHHLWVTGQDFDPAR